jgi:hypothetical protein
MYTLNETGATRECVERGVTTTAAAHGHYDCLKFLHKQGFPIDFSLTTVAYLNNQRRCYDWGIKKGLPEPQFFTQKKELNKTITITQVEKEWQDE